MFSPDTEWHYRITDSIMGTTTEYTATMRDSMVNGIVYQEIYGGLLRTEDTKVWCVIDSLGTPVEQLLYDFDMQVGDSIRTLHFAEYDPYDPPYYAKVTKVETIMLSDGRQARRISYDGRSDDIEHIGNVNGIFGATIQVLPPDGVHSDFICCTRGDYLLYEIIEGECDNITAVENVISDSPSATKIYHEDQILIKSGEKVYTLQGQEVK
ncbi:MAG: hypothetical protein IJS82_03880 [Paludibacteraceae bacterium]|nr:hypothetical protein [Paludibacteraceae bacterium]